MVCVVLVESSEKRGTHTAESTDWSFLSFSVSARGSVLSNLLPKTPTAIACGAIARRYAAGTCGKVRVLMPRLAWDCLQHRMRSYALGRRVLMPFLRLI